MTQKQAFNGKATPSMAVIRRFMDAAAAGDLDAVRKTVEKYPDAVNWRDKNSYTALHYAAAAGHTDLATYLLDNHADVNARTTAATAWNSVTPLIVASEWEKNLDTLKLLIARGADLNAATGMGETALMRAANHSAYPANQGQGEKVLRTLIAAGADATLTNGDERTALDITVNLGEAQAATAIREAVAAKATADAASAQQDQQTRDAAIDSAMTDGIAQPAAITPPLKLKKGPFG
jgi:ankyrin repeat protein